MGESVVNEKNNQELASVLIDEYMNLQRILTSSNRDLEINYQIKGIKAKLESMGIVTTDLNLIKNEQETT